MSLRITALLGFLSVLLGAMGAHGHVYDVVQSHGYLPEWQTAVRYQQVHVVALLALLLGTRHLPPSKLISTTVVAWMVGILIFSGTLYVIGYTGIKWLGAVTPIGGLALMVGWLTLAIAAPRLLKSRP